MERPNIQAEYSNGFYPLASLNGSPIEKPEFAASDQELSLKTNTIDLLTQIRSTKPQNGKITSGARSIGSNFRSG